MVLEWLMLVLSASCAGARRVALELPDNRCAETMTDCLLVYMLPPQPRLQLYDVTATAATSLTTYASLVQALK